jgi:hypothetical protein
MADLLAYNTIDRYEKESDNEDSIGVAGIKNVSKDEKGIYRRKDSKWLVAGAYGNAAPATSNAMPT